MKYKLLTAFMSAAMLFGASAFAQNSIDVTYDDVEAKVYVELDKGGFLAGVAVINPNITAVDNTNINSAVQYTEQVNVPEDGKFDFSFLWRDNSDFGRYKVIVSVPDSDIAYEEEFTFINSNLQGAILEAFNASSPDYETLLNTYVTDLGALNIKLDKLYSDNKQAIIDGFKAYRLKVGKFSDISQIEKGFNFERSLIAVNNAANDTMESVITEAGGYSLIVLGEHYDKYSAEIGKAVLDMRPQNGFAGFDDVTNAYKSAYVLTCASLINEVSVMDKFITDNAQWIGLSSAEVNAYKNKTNPTVGASLVGKSFNSLNDLKTAVVNKINEQSPVPPASVGGGGGGSYPISTRPSGVVTPIIPAPTQKPSEAFSDLDSVPWAKEAITYLKAQGIVSGNGNGEFLPNDNITREEFVAIVVRAFNFKTTAKESVFTDVAENVWYFEPVMAAYENGIISGKSDTVFGTGDNITREEMAAIIKRVVDKSGIELPDKKDVNFSDSEEISQYALDAVEALSRAGIINGMENNEFQPKGECTRAQTAKVVYEILKISN